MPTVRETGLAILEMGEPLVKRRRHFLQFARCPLLVSVNSTPHVFIFIPYLGARSMCTHESLFKIFRKSH